MTMFTPKTRFHEISIKELMLGVINIDLYKAILFKGKCRNCKQHGLVLCRL